MPFMPGGFFFKKTGSVDLHILCILIFSNVQGAKEARVEFLFWGLSVCCS